MHLRKKTPGVSNVCAVDQLALCKRAPLRLVGAHHCAVHTPIKNRTTDHWRAPTPATLQPVTPYKTPPIRPEGQPACPTVTPLRLYTQHLGDGDRRSFEAWDGLLTEAAPKRRNRLRKRIADPQVQDSAPTLKRCAGGCVV